MKIEVLLKKVEELGIELFTGVPDSQLKELCDTIMNKYGVSKNHIVAANEGAAMALAAGHYLATKKPALVYMQNSGIGNAINPICSLLNDKVYKIPALLVVGWRGEPNLKDEPQHVFQGEITVELLEQVDVSTYILDKETTESDLDSIFVEIQSKFEIGKQCALVIKKGALESDVKMKYNNEFELTREEAVEIIIKKTNDGDVFVSTTGKLSRELFELREKANQGHMYDFLTVGSMGHASMIALGIANVKSERKVYCLDGDGAAIMHMGNLAVSGSNNLPNFIHILINNGAHETVGGIPTVSNSLNYGAIAKACGYKTIRNADNRNQLEVIMDEISELEGPIFIEVKTNLLSRADLGRPTTTPVENKEAFMSYLSEK